MYILKLTFQGRGGCKRGSTASTLIVFVQFLSVYVKFFFGGAFVSYLQHIVLLRENALLNGFQSITFIIYKTISLFLIPNCSNIRPKFWVHLVHLGCPVRAYVKYLYHNYFTNWLLVKWFLLHNFLFIIRFCPFLTPNRSNIIQKL